MTPEVEFCKIKIKLSILFEKQPKMSICRSDSKTSVFNQNYVPELLDMFEPPFDFVDAFSLV